MTLTVSNHRVPSTLADVIRQVKQAFSLVGNALPIQVGVNYRKSFGVGSPPKVLFVPESPGGKILPPYQMGRPASYLHSCKVYIRGREAADDIDRFENTYKLADQVIGAIAVAGSGRIEWGAVEDDSPTDTNAYGAGLVIGFTFRRDIQPFDERWRLEPADEDRSKYMHDLLQLIGYSPDETSATIEPTTSDGIAINPTTTPQ